MTAANLLTALNFLCGLSAILAAAQHRLFLCLWLILAGVLFDGVDGKVARFLCQENPFGKMLDTLADLVSFGIAPSVYFYVYSVICQETKWLWISYVFALSAIYRLVRFSVFGNEQNYFRGLPTTCAASFLASFAILFQSSPNHFPLFIILYLVLSALMVSHIRFYNPRQFSFHRIYLRKTLFLVLTVIIAMLIFGLVEIIFFFSAVYITATLVWNLFPRKVNA